MQQSIPVQSSYRVPTNIPHNTYQRVTPSASHSNLRPQGSLSTPYGSSSSYTQSSRCGQVANGDWAYGQPPNYETQRLPSHSLRRYQASGHARDEDDGNMHRGGPYPKRQRQQGPQARDGNESAGSWASTLPYNGPCYWPADKPGPPCYLECVHTFTQIQSLPPSPTPSISCQFHTSSIINSNHPPHPENSTPQSSPFT